MGSELSYYSSSVEFDGGRNLTVFVKTRNMPWAKYYTKKRLEKNEKTWKIKDTVLLDEKKERYLLRSVHDFLLTLPKEGVWHVEESGNGIQYIGRSKGAAQCGHNPNVAETKQKSIPFNEDKEAQQHLIEALMYNKVDS